MTEIATPNRTYTIDPAGPTHTGEFSTVFSADTSDGGRVALKLATPGLDDAVADEALTLASMLGQVKPEHRPFLPNLVESFPHEDTWINAFTYYDGWYTLAQVQQRYPAGLDPRDMAWIARRLLAVIGVAKEAGFVHGAVLPQHVLIHPTDHGLVLLDWCHATPESSSDIERMSLACPRWYPADRVANAALDLDLAAKTLIFILGGNPEAALAGLPPTVPKQYRAFFGACFQASDKIHPWTALKHFDELLERLYGKRRYRPLDMSPATTP